MVGRGRPISMRCATGFILVCLATFAAPGLAGPPLKRNIPNGTRPGVKPSNLALQVTAEWTGGPGYVPFSIAASPVNISPTTDRNLFVRLAIGSQYGGYRDSQLTTGVRLTIPAGTPVNTPVSASLAIPEGWQLNQQIQISVIEDGYEWEELSEYHWLNSGSNNPSQPTVLFVGGTKTSSLANGNSLLAISAKSLPDEWINLTSVQVVCLSVAELESLAATEPTKLTALRRWAQAGGAVVVETGGDAREAISRAFSLPPNSTTGRWRLLSPHDIAPSIYNNNVGSSGGSFPIDLAERKVLAESIFQHPLGHGLVFAASDSTLRQRIGSNTGAWMLLPRTAPGEVQGLQNGWGLEFWNFVIPGVGRAPVWQFVVLITLFVLAIGPINYWWLRQRQRLALMLITVPLGAALVTVTLVGYALLADGLGVRLRARSFTVLDQVAGEASCASRLSYYAGLAPSGGLTFSRDTAVFPYDDPPSGYRDSRVRRSRSIRWEAEAQRLESGWLPARTPTQLMTLRARETAAKLTIKVAADGKTATIANGLGSRIQRLLVSGDDGTLYAGRDIAVEQQSTLQPATADERENLCDEIVHTFPVAPPDVDEMLLTTGRSYEYAKTTSGNKIVDVSNRDSVLESGIARVVRLLHDNQIPPRTYLAIVDRSPEFEAGITNYTAVDSLHLIWGTW